VSEVHEILAEAEREGFVDSDSMWELLHHLQRGDLRPLEKAARKPEDKNVSDWLDRRGDLAEIVVSVCLDMAPDSLV
jgi:hypothetical protein